MWLIERLGSMDWLKRANSRRADMASHPPTMNNNPPRMIRALRSAPGCT